MRSVIFRYVFLCTILLAFRVSAQQTPYLEKLVTVKYATQTYSELFKNLSNQTGVVFSYTSFDDNQKIIIQYAKKPLRIVLNELFDDGSCTYKLKGKYIILTCKEKSQPSPDIQLEGYIYDAVDSSMVGFSSVYLRQNKQSVVTDDFGYFTIKCPKTASVLSISVAREHYRDTTVVILSKKARQTITIYLQPEQQVHVELDSSVNVVVDSSKAIDTVTEMPATIDSVKKEERFPFLQRLGKVNINRLNISDTFFTNVAFAFIPAVSTNKLLSINTVNNYAFNLFAGYSKGINVLEFAGVANLDDGNVRWAQIAGISNTVSGEVKGFQLGGIVNRVKKDVEGLQIGGIANIDGGNVRWAQIGGIANTVSGTMEGIQVGGIVNRVGKDVLGMQVGGITNIVSGNVQGLQVGGIYNYGSVVIGGQIAGIANEARFKVDGLQLAGIANHTDTINGFQVAGIVNKARLVKGFQLAGLVNKAEHVVGSQIAFINISKSVTGVPFGFLSYVHTGYHKIELATDEQLLTTIGFRTGVNVLHNTFFVGIQPSGGNKLWTYGYGLGSAVRLNKKWYLNADVSAQQVQFTRTPEILLNLLSKGYLGIEWRFASKLSLAAGPTINFLFSDNTAADFQLIQKTFDEKPLYDFTINDAYHKAWIGGKVSLKFL